MQTQLQGCEMTGKKCFQTEGDALRCEIDNRRRYPQQEQQYPYLCEHCGFHHLSAKPAGELTRAKVIYDDKYAVRQNKRTPEEQLKLRDQVVSLTRQGLTGKQIADKLEISMMTVYNLRNGKMSSALSKTVEGIEVRQLSIQEQITRLQAQLQEEERRKQQIIEARQLKVQWSEVEGGDRILLITQDLNRLPLTPEDAAKLHELLEEVLRADGTGGLIAA